MDARVIIKAAASTMNELCPYDETKVAAINEALYPEKEPDKHDKMLLEYRESLEKTINKAQQWLVKNGFYNKEDWKLEKSNPNIFDSRELDKGNRDLAPRLKTDKDMNILMSKKDFTDGRLSKQSISQSLKSFTVEKIDRYIPESHREYIDKFKRDFEKMINRFDNERSNMISRIIPGKIKDMRDDISNHERMASTKMFLSRTIDIENQFSEMKNKASNFVADRLSDAAGYFRDHS